jgi:hypothetical protein
MSARSFGPKFDGEESAGIGVRISFCFASLLHFSRREAITWILVPGLV